LKELIKKD